MRTPAQVGLSPAVVSKLQSTIRGGRWALWRHGYLVHVQGSFNSTTEVKSLRKTFHSATIGALIQQGKIASVDRPLTDWNAGVSGGPGNCHLQATLRHVMSQTSTFDESGMCPEDLWAYSDANPPRVNRVAARAWRGTNSTDYNTNYAEVIGGALLGRIGATGWSTSVSSDGIRMKVDLEDLGRLGILLANSGRWGDAQVIPASYVDQMASKRTYGIPPNYDNDNDGELGLRESDFPESPYGFLTWVNTDRDLFPQADPTWAQGWGDGGHYLLFDPASGVVMAILASSEKFTPKEPRAGRPIRATAVVHALQAHIAGPDPLATCVPACTGDADCDDGLACNGSEACDDGSCAAGTPVDCGDGSFCNGAELCDETLGCVSGTDPCGGRVCDEAIDRCETGELAFEGSQVGTATDRAQVSATVSAVGDLYLAAVTAKPLKRVTAVSGLGLVWEPLVDQCSGRSATGVSVWMARGVAASAGTVTATLDSVAASAAIAVTRYSGSDVADPIGAALSGNTRGLGGACTGGTDRNAYDFDLATQSSGSAVWVAAAMRNRTHTPGAGYAERVEVTAGSSGDAAALAIQDRSAPAAALVPVEGSFSGSVDWAVIGLELRAR